MPSHRRDDLWRVCLATLLFVASHAEAQTLSRFLQEPIRFEFGGGDDKDICNARAFDDRVVGWSVEGMDESSCDDTGSRFACAGDCDGSILYSPASVTNRGPGEVFTVHVRMGFEFDETGLDCGGTVTVDDLLVWQQVAPSGIREVSFLMPSDGVVRFTETGNCQISMQSMELEPAGCGMVHYDFGTENSTNCEDLWDPWQYRVGFKLFANDSSRDVMAYGGNSFADANNGLLDVSPQNVCMLSRYGDNPTEIFAKPSNESNYRNNGTETTFWCGACDPGTLSGCTNNAVLDENFDWLSTFEQGDCQNDNPSATAKAMTELTCWFDYTPIYPNTAGPQQIQIGDPTGLSATAAAGITFSATIFAFAAGILVFYLSCWRPRHRQKEGDKTLRALQLMETIDKAGVQMSDLQTLVLRAKKNKANGSGSEGGGKHSPEPSAPGPPTVDSDAESPAGPSSQRAHLLAPGAGSEGVMKDPSGDLEAQQPGASRGNSKARSRSRTRLPLAQKYKGKTNARVVELGEISPQSSLAQISQEDETPGSTKRRVKRAPSPAQARDSLDRAGIRRRPSNQLDSVPKRKVEDFAYDSDSSWLTEAAYSDSDCSGYESWQYRKPGENDYAPEPDLIDDDPKQSGKPLPANRAERCDECGKTIRGRSNFLTHMREQHGVSKRFACKTCGREFARKYNLEQHERTHLSQNARPHACSMCDETFAQKSNLKRHMLTNHLKPLKCPLCKTRFATQDEGREHYSKKHPKERYVEVRPRRLPTRAFSCVCRTKFHRFSELQKHQRHCKQAGGNALSDDESAIPEDELKLPPINTAPGTLPAFATISPPASQGVASSVSSRHASRTPRDESPDPALAPSPVEPPPPFQASDALNSPLTHADLYATLQNLNLTSPKQPPNLQQQQLATLNAARLQMQQSAATLDKLQKGLIEIQRIQLEHAQQRQPLPPEYELLRQQQQANLNIAMQNYALLQKQSAQAAAQLPLAVSPDGSPVGAIDPAALSPSQPLFTSGQLQTAGSLQPSPPASSLPVAEPVALPAQGTEARQQSAVDNASSSPQPTSDALAHQLRPPAERFSSWNSASSAQSLAPSDGVAQLRPPAERFSSWNSASSAQSLLDRQGSAGLDVLSSIGSQASPRAGRQTSSGSATFPKIGALPPMAAGAGTDPMLDGGLARVGSGRRSRSPSASLSKQSLHSNHSDSMRLHLQESTSLQNLLLSTELASPSPLNMLALGQEQENGPMQS